jgi:hypothetical protein
MKYDIGDGVRLSVVFTTAIDGQHVDPTTLEFTLQLPDGTSAQGVTINQTATGKYYADYVATLPGVHYYRWAGTGACQAAAEGAFTVSRSLING